MILIVFCVLVAIAGSTFAAYKSNRSILRRIIGGFLLFCSTFLLIMSVTVSESDFFSILIGPLFFSVLSIWLLYPTRKKLYITVIAVCTVYAVLLSSYNNYTSNKLDERWDDIELIAKNIDGTIWQNIEPNYDDNIVYWYRMEFKDGKVYFYRALPSDGEWGEPHVSEYTIGQERYRNTGRKYLFVEWKGLSEVYKLVPKDRHVFIYFPLVKRGGNIDVTEGDIPAWRD